MNLPPPARDWQGRGAFEDLAGIDCSVVEPGDRDADRAVVMLARREARMAGRRRPLPDARGGWGIHRKGRVGRVGSLARWFVGSPYPARRIRIGGVFSTLRLPAQPAPTMSSAETANPATNRTQPGR